ncbi:MAG: Uma2 family endonuclease [Planctomycetota bacterium]
MARRLAMSGADKLELVGVDEYLISQESVSTKSEYIDGRVRAMTGATNRHNRVKLSAAFSFMKSLSGRPCIVWDSDTKLRIVHQQSRRFYYPDLQVVCEPNLPSETFQDRPVLVLEVLSPTTRLYDLDEKLTAYTKIPSLQYYLILEQHQPIAILYRRCGSWFERLEFQGMDQSIDMPRVGLSLALSAVYEGIEFTPTCVQEPDPEYDDG